jgi:RND family efflux transporter MFP subunit
MELPFPVTTAQTVTVPQEQVLDGVVEAVNQSTVSAQTSGRVQEIRVDVNDVVPAGTLIVRLRDAEQRAALAQAQAASVEAQARLREAQAEYNRVQGLYDRKLVSAADMDAASAALNAARARLDAAQAGIDQAQEQLDHTQIKAPYSGIVLRRHVSIGETVRPGQPLMSGFSLDQLRAVVGVPQRLIETVRRYQQARVILPGGGRSDSDSGVPATKLTFFPYADPDSNVFKVRVYLPQKSAGVYPGMFVKVAFSVGETAPLTVPRQALVQRSEVSGVYVIADGAISLRQVRVGRPVAGDRVEVLAGLDAGERIALDPIAAGRYLKESAR